jgi:predicted amidohydrolase YtcJ
MKYLLVLFISIALFSCQQNNADLIVKNAHIYTVNEAFDTAQVLVIKDGKFLAVGGDSLLAIYHSENTIDAKGQYIYPGFMDAHCHFTGYAKDKYKLALFGTKSFNEVIEKLVAYARTNKRAWIEGRGWDQNDWEKKEFPNKDTLDQLFPNTPVFLMRIDGHAILCNQKALDLANITTSTLVKGGEVEVMNGKMTGMLIDNAVDIVKKVLPARTEQEIIADFVDAEKDCVELGLTSVVDCGISKSTVEHLQKAYSENKLQIRNSVMLSDEKENYDAYLNKKPIVEDRFHIVGYKVYADGALGSRGAYLIEPYSDKHHHHGYLLTAIDSMRGIAKKVIQTEYQLCTHAIGDGANREVLKIYAEALQGKNDRRWRVEHAQVLNKNDFHYFGDYNIVPCVQPTHATSDMYWATDRVGSTRIKDAYAYKKLLLQNNWLPLGTDFPVESLNPLLTFYAAVFRIDKNQWPNNGYEMENAISRQEALKGITIWAAKSVFEEKVKGSIEKGKMADFVILPADLIQASASEIYNLPVTATYIQGKALYTGKK